MGRFVKGQSGNPGGRKKIPEDVREAARLLTPRALEVQASIMDDPDAPPQARIAAAENIINRAYGKPEGNVNLTMSAGAAFIEMLKVVHADLAHKPASNGHDTDEATVRH